MPCLAPGRSARSVPSSLVVLALACGGACGACGGAGDGDPTTPQTGAATLVASKVAVLAVAVATGGQGHAFFDNFVPCPRRGVIDYRNTATGRRATFTGCDAGDGVVVDGTVDLTWPASGGDPARIATIGVASGLQARVGGAAAVAVGPLVISGIAYATGQEPSVLTLTTATVRVSAGGSSAGAPLDARATPASVFAPPGLTIDALPNAANALDALTEADLKRIAYHGAMQLAGVLFDETLETQRGDHAHQLGCGTIGVVQNAATRLPRLDNAWTACDLGLGLFASGAFTLEWAQFDATAGRLSMTGAGTLTFGGGVPRITLSRMEWTITGIGSLPGTARIEGRLVAGTGQRTFSFDLVLDD